MKAFRLPGWILLMVLWPLFARSHSWKVSRESVDYKCYTLDEWTDFVKSDMPAHESLMQTVIDGMFWAIILLILILSFAAPSKAETIWGVSAGYSVPLNNVCTLKANSDIHIRVVEKRPRWRSWDYFLWEGDLKRGQTVQIKNHSGKIRYSYTPTGHNRSFGDNRATCNGNWVNVP